MKKFVPLELETQKPEDIFQDYKRDLSKKIIEAIEYGVNNDKKQVLFAKIYINGIICVSLSVNHMEYLEILEQNIENLIEFEEYETCALAVKLKETLSAK